jgi:hypothetical protein
VIGGVAPGRYTTAILVGHERTGLEASPRFLFSNGETTRERAHGMNVKEGTIADAGTMVLPAATRIGLIAGIVQHDDGTPAADIKVAMKIDVDDPGVPWTTIATDREGRFTFGAVAGVTYRIVAQPSNPRATRRAIVTVDSGKPTKPIRLILP